jgi:cell wall assembly regulator SMI1
MTLQGALLAWLAYLSTLGVDMRAQLNPPATDAQIAAMEAIVGGRLPDDLRELYLFANGQQFPDDFVRARPGSSTAFLFGHYEFMDLREAASSSNREWFAFASDGGGNYYAVVLVPGQGETRGEVIVIGRDEDRRVLAPNLTTFLARAAERRPPISDRDGHWVAVRMEEGR